MSYNTKALIHRTNILGVGVSAIDIPMAIQVIEKWIEDEVSAYVCVTGVHGIMESQKDDDLRSIHNMAGLVSPDGMPLVWLSKINGLKHVNRVYGPDLMFALCDLSQSKDYSHYLYGADDNTLELLKSNLLKRFPNINLVGAYSPPFRELTEEEDLFIIDMINRTSPNIVWVGLGTPKQEHWMASHVATLNGAVLIGVGAAFDFHAGLKKQAPYWMQRNGLEWLFRLSEEPKRLWRRYLINNPKFIFFVFLQKIGLKKYTIN